MSSAKWLLPRVWMSSFRFTRKAVRARRAERSEFEEELEGWTSFSGSLIFEV